MNELDNLRPEVREALERMIVLCSAANKIGKWMRADCDTVIIAELLRLAEYEQAAGRLAVEKAEFRQRAEKAEAELAALKARMKPCARVRDGEVHVYMDTAHEGKEVAVVVVED